MTLVADPQGSSLEGALGALGGYQLLERVGAGGLGEVFRARDTRHGRTVAIKRLPGRLTADSVRLDALRQTAERLSAVSHPGIAMLYECSSDDRQGFLAQEFVAGQWLPQLLAGRPVNPRRAVELAIEMADALAALHAAGLVHGDLRPETVAVTQKGHVKLLDAGLASFTGGGALRLSASRRLGSLAPDTLPVVRSLAPEEALGEGIDARADLFALGLVLYEMLTGQPAFDRPTADQALLAVLQATPAPPSVRQPTVTPVLDRLVARALAKPLDRRYQTATALGDDLRAIRAAMEADLADAAPPAVVAAGRAPRPAWWAVLVVAAAAAGAAAWWLFGR
jgi:serine/threonine protein kinase